MSVVDGDVLNDSGAKVQIALPAFTVNIHSLYLLTKVFSSNV